MVTAAEAEKLILAQADLLDAEAVSLQEAHGRVLREPIIADRDFPPFTRVSMDGIAIRFQDFSEGQRTFSIAGIQAAGAPSLTLHRSGCCLEVMTGAVLPEGTDTIIRYEDLAIEDGNATVLIDDIREGQHAHPKGLDRQAGDQLVPAGTLLSPGEIGLAATVGNGKLQVTRQPRIAVIYTGDELIGVDQQPAAHQIRASNGFTLRAVLLNQGCTADQFHLPDDAAVIKEKLSVWLQHYDALFMSGGVSKGKFDYLPECLQQLAVERLFYKVHQRPGKPFWFGRKSNGAVVFALPGNPVSALICTIRYGVPWVRKSLGLPLASPAYAMLAEPFEFKRELTYFLAIRVRSDSTTGKLRAYPIPGRGSGDLANLALADGFLELPAGKQYYQKGEVYPVFLYR